MSANRPLHRSPRPAAEAGQALVEASVGALLLILALGAIMLVGRLQSVEIATVGAARTLAFECPVRPWACAANEPDDALQNELRRRHFGHPNRQILTADGFAADSAEDELHPFWPAGRQAPRMIEPKSVAMAFEHPSLDAGLNTAAGAAGSISSEASRILSSVAGPARFGLDPRSGLSVAKIDVPANLALPALPSDSGQSLLSLRLRARTAILADAWNATTARGAESDSLETRVRAGSRLDSFRESSLALGYALTRSSLSVMGAAGLEPAADRFHPYQPDVRIVPADRVSR